MRDHSSFAMIRIVLTLSVTRTHPLVAQDDMSLIFTIVGKYCLWRSTVALYYV
jgi:hypothetical protein